MDVVVNYLSVGYLAQLGEHLFDVQKVIGSIPIVPTNLKIISLFCRDFLLFRFLETVFRPKLKSLKKEISKI